MKWTASTLLIGLVLLAGCEQEMQYQARLNPYDPSELPQQLPDYIVSTTMETAGQIVDMAVLERGQERHAIYCQPCHGGSGRGDGIIVHRGFPPPPSYGTSVGQGDETTNIASIIRNGKGIMYGFKGVIPPDDQMAIALYVEALADVERKSPQVKSGGVTQ